MKTVCVFGSFNILHPGHLRLLRFAKESGDRLIVAVKSDRLAGQDAHVHESVRLEGVRSIGWVDDAFLFDKTVSEVILQLRPDIVIKGKEHEHESNPESAALSHYGGQLVFSSGETIFSSLDLIRKEFQSLTPLSISFPVDYLERHGIEKSKLIALINGFKEIKVCVIGDLIVDEYITCDPLGMSQEDPTIVVTPVDSKCFIGGAGIVAGHASGLGSNVYFASVSGNDPMRNFAINCLAAAKVDAQVLIDDSRPTTLKQRYRSKGKSLLRVSHLHQGAISSELQERLLRSLEKVMDDANLLVFSDFNYGCLPQSLVDQIIAMAKSRGILLAADSQSSSQVGDITRFRGMNLITPTEREARVSTRNREDGLIILAEQLRQQALATNVLLKLGEEGLLIHADNANGNGDDWLTDRVEALNLAPKDVAGAGDSLLITSALALASGGTIWEAAYLGSLAAAVQVGRVGNTPLNADDLINVLG